MIRENIGRIEAKISSICEKIKRDPQDITLVGVTKYADTGQLNEAVKAGLLHIGENRVQEAQKKFAGLEGSDQVTKHMIGHLQSNKVKQAIQLFDLIQSVDRFSLAQEIQKQAEKLNVTVDILLQVNTSKEEQKQGFARSDVTDVVKLMEDLKNIRVCGLMTIAPLTDDKEWIRKTFYKLRVLFEELSQQYCDHDRIEMKILSMGMSSDFEIALEEGANMIRIGRAIFEG